MLNEGDIDDLLNRFKHPESEQDFQIRQLLAPKINFVMKYEDIHNALNEFLSKRFDIVEVDKFPTKIRIRVKDKLSGMFSVIYEDISYLMFEFARDSEEQLHRILYNLKNEMRF